MKVALLLGAVLVLIVGVPGSSAAATFEDPIGDQVPFEDLVAPDISRVEVSNTGAGVITFRVRIVNYDTLPPLSRIAVLFDVDRDFSTGDNGFEYAVSHRVESTSETRLLLERWEASSFEMVEVSSSGLASSFAAGLLTLSIPRSRLENTIEFDFGLYAALFHPTRQNRAAVDSAPNANIWTYTLSGLPPPRLAASRLVLNPRRPVAGRPLVVTSVVTRRDTGTAVPATSTRVTCTARLGGTALRARGVLQAGRARCLIAIPRAGKGKLLRGTITVRSAGAVVTRRFSLRVN